MARILLILSVLATIFVSCNSNEKESKVSQNEFYEFFYPFDTIPKVYVYRDKIHGMEETFHRIYSVNDSQGKFTVVETYSTDGRILEALTFDIDSLNVYDHMVVKSEKERIKSYLPKNDFFPMNEKDAGNLIQVIPINDTLAVSREIIRNYSDRLSMNVLGEDRNSVLFSDYILMKSVEKNKTENRSLSSGASYYFSEGIGLSRWHTDKKEVDFVLQKIISQKEFIQLMSIK